VKRILIVGTGSIGERHLRCFQKTGRAEVGFCEINDDLRNTIAERYAVSEAYASLDDALEASWDAAVICTPAPFHIANAIQIGRCGVDMMIEKPLATTLDGLDELRQVIAEQQLKVNIAYVFRAHPVLADMREALASGRFGRAVQITVVCGQHFPTYRPAYREIYYTDRAKGGGAIQDCLTHLLNAGEWLVGPITRLAADAEHLVLEGVEVEDTVNLLCRHGAVMGCYSLTQHQAPNETSITVHCEKGSLQFELHNLRWRWMDDPQSQQWHDNPHEPMERDDWFIAQENAFLDYLDDQAGPLCTLDEGAQTLRVNMAALDSADHDGRWVRIPQEN
jgi:predicted dehydrogenase